MINVLIINPALRNTKKQTTIEVLFMFDESDAGILEEEAEDW